MLKRGMTKRKKMLYCLYVVLKHIQTEGKYRCVTIDVTTGDP